MSRLSGEYREFTYDPGSTSAGSFKATDLTFPGTKKGDFVLVSVDQDVQDMLMTANVNSDDTVTLLFNNNTAGAINLPSMTVRIKVIPADHI